MTKFEEINQEEIKRLQEEWEAKHGDPKSELSLLTRIKIELFGCEHKFEQAGGEMYWTQGPHLSIDETRLVYEKRWFKRERCRICGEWRHNYTDYETVDICEVGVDE